MTRRRVVLWRHGRTAYNAAGRLQGQVDIPLDDVGRWQARTAAGVLVEHTRPHLVVSSDLGRAVQTAEQLTGLSGVDLVVDSRLRERSFGAWEGLSAAEIAERWPVEHALWVRGGEPEREGGETRAEVAARMLTAIAEHTEHLPEGHTLVVVSHGAAITIGIGALLGLDPAWRGLGGVGNGHWAELLPGRRPGGESSTGLSHHAPGEAWRLTGYNIGPLGVSATWDSGPEEKVGTPTAVGDAFGVRNP